MRVQRDIDYFRVMKLKELKEIFNTELSTLYSAEESQIILTYILIDALGIPKLTILSQPGFELDNKQAEKVFNLLQNLKKGKPIQYLLGTAHFYGMMLKVTPDVLIPRQETEELVDWIIKDNKEAKLRILDVGTGSGCIALALKKYLPESTVTAIDKSEEALVVAKKNAKDLNLDIRFIKADALNLKKGLESESYDIIVSNPPYIPSSNKDSVQKSVLLHEPHIALFVPDEKPLLFYESIANYARLKESFGQAKKSKPAMLYFEIYEDFGDKITELLSNMGFKDIILKKDLNGKNRMLRCRYFF